MIAAAAFCPHPPVLVPEIAQGAAVETQPLRDACRTALRRITAPGRSLVLIGTGPASLVHSPLARGTFAGLGIPGELHLGAPTCGGDLELPLSLTVGAWLVRDVLGPRSGARGFSVGPDFATSGAAVELLRLAEAEEIALLVVGDGSARRSTAAPGYLDERAADFDAAVSAALASGEGARLAGIDLGLGTELLAAGVPAWHAAAAVLGDAYRAELLYDDAPFGVGYFVAAWTT